MDKRILKLLRKAGKDLERQICRHDKYLNENDINKIDVNKLSQLVERCDFSATYFKALCDILRVLGCNESDIESINTIAYHYISKW